MRSGVGVWPRVMKRENRRRREERELSSVLYMGVGRRNEGALPSIMAERKKERQVSGIISEREKTGKRHIN